MTNLSDTILTPLQSPNQNNVPRSKFERPKCYKRRKSQRRPEKFSSGFLLPNTLRNQKHNLTSFSTYILCPKNQKKNLQHSRLLSLLSIKARRTQVSGSPLPMTTRMPIKVI